jgi:hypothetical protein
MTLVFFLVIPSNVDREALIGLATMPSLSILLYACFIHLQRRPPKTLVRAVEAAIDERFDVSVAVDAGLNKFVGRTQDGRYVEGRLIVNHGVSNQVVVVFEQE